MLSADPKRRPKAIELLHGIAAHEVHPNEEPTPSIFGDCCKRTLVTQSQLRKMGEDTAQLTEELGKQRREASLTQSRFESLMEMSTESRRQMSRLQDAFDEKSSKLDETEAILRVASNHRVEKSRLCDQLKERLTNSQTAYFNLKGEVLDLRAQLTAFRNPNKLEGRTLDVEDTISSETIFKQDGDRPSYLSHDSEGQDERIAQARREKSLNEYAQLRAPVGPNYEPPDSTFEYDHVSRRKSPRTLELRDSAPDLALETLGKRKLSRSASSQTNVPAVPHREQFAKAKGSGARGREPNVFLRAFAGLKSGAAEAKQVAKEAYEQGKTREDGAPSRGTKTIYRVSHDEQGREMLSKVSYGERRTAEEGTASSKRRSR